MQLCQATRPITRFGTLSNVYFNELHQENIRFISPLIDNTMSSTRVEINDVLLNITGGSIGRCCVYHQSLPANVNQHVCIIRCRNELLSPDYLAHVLYSSIGVNAIATCQNEGNRESLTFPQIGAFLIPLPPIDEQKKILAVVSEKTNPLNQVITQIEKEIVLATEYKNSLISSAVTGQIDLRNTEVELVVPDDQLAEDDSDLAAAEESEPATEESEG